jgi:hypothetical protein
VPLADFHDEEFCRLLYKEKTDGSQYLRNRFHDEEFCRLPINVKTERKRKNVTIISCWPSQGASAAV